MNKWMKTYWRTRSQGNFINGIGYELNYAIKKNDKKAIEDILEENPWSYKGVMFPSEEIQLIAVQKRPFLVRVTHGGATERVQILAVSVDPDLIGDMYDATENVQLAAVKKDGDVIKYIEDPSEEVKLAAVKQNGNAIEHIKDPSLDVQLISVANTESDPCDVLDHILHHYYSNYYDEELEKYTDQIPYELQKIAMKNCSKALRWLVIYHQIEVTEELQKIVLEEYYAYGVRMLSSVGVRISDEVQIWAIENSLFPPHTLKDIATDKVKDYLKSKGYDSTGI